MATITEKIITKFFGGIVRDDKSRILGGANNVEEIDIFANADFIQAEQINSADSMPATTEIYAYASGDRTTSTDPVMYGYGKETSGSKVRLVSVASGGADNPGDFGTLFTSADTTNIATLVSDLKFLRDTASSNPTSLYYIQGASTTWYLVRYNIGAAAEQIWNGSAWAAGSSDSNSDLTGLDGSFMRPTMKVIFGELYICHGQYIAKVDKDATFTEKKFTLPKEWEAVDIIGVADIFLILCRNKNRSANFCKAFWWDGVSASQFNDSFALPCGVPLWVVNHQERIKIAAASNGGAVTTTNGILRLFQLSGAFPGAVPIELPGLALSNIQSDATTQPISSPKMVSEKDKILYFGLYKNDKTGIYALGQLDADKPNALILSKRFTTSASDYSTHKPTALHIQGPNYYGAYYNGSAQVNSRCESNNSPSRSSDAVYESIFDDDGDPRVDKLLEEAAILSRPLPASTSVALSVAKNYGSYTTYTREDKTNFTGTDALLGHYKPGVQGKVLQYKISFTSSGVNSAKITGLYLKLNKSKSY